jgi:hypothetical protein
MHEDIVEHVSYERGKNSQGVVMDDYDAGRAVERQLISKPLDEIMNQLEELLYLVGDRPEPASEDEIMNYIIGMIESVKIKKSKISIET